ncbi:intracellular hyaluronan-binding protein 4 isoform X1 [Poecilia latipinna]|uniref:Hyaluronan binding protein 4 n=1 Tax=Poecilia latipinna TaxID=48699 RepID=A0A3B3V633_9TELE|nr:PREDICTED: intracellular hyaluronan-binding protein 4 isoform X1 [Poecilia latipinna]
MLQDAFGCVVANRFGDLLDDEADPFDLISEVELEKEKKKKKKKEDEDKKSKQKKPGLKESQRNRRLPVASGGPDLVPGRKQQDCPPLAKEDRDSRAEAPRNKQRGGAAGQRRLSQVDPQEFSVPKPSYTEASDFSSRGGFTGRRGARGGGGRNSDNFYLRGKREYDRHDGTGISSEEKRGGRGPWNWGSAVEAPSEMMEVTSDAGTKAEEPQSTLEEENPTRAPDEDNEMVVQVAMEMTLDEWKAMQEVNRPKVEFNIRKAEDKIPSKAKVIHQSKHLENTKETVEEIEEDGHFFRRSVNDITTLLDINFGSLGRPSRGGRGRGARGGQSVRPERARPIYEKEDEMAPDPDDPEDFPALTAGK